MPLYKIEWKKSAVIPFIEWQNILEAIEELDDIRSYDKEKSIESDVIPFDQAIQEIQEKKLN